jgi:hypothetical protein
MTVNDVPAAYQLLKKYLEKFKLVAEFTQEVSSFYPQPDLESVFFLTFDKFTPWCGISV